MSDVAAVQDKLKLGLATDCPTNPLCGRRLKDAYGIDTTNATLLVGVRHADGAGARRQDHRPRRALLDAAGHPRQRLRPAPGRQEDPAGRQHLAAGPQRLPGQDRQGRRSRSSSTTCRPRSTRRRSPTCTSRSASTRRTSRTWSRPGSRPRASSSSPSRREHQGPGHAGALFVGRHGMPMTDRQSVTVSRRSRPVEAAGLAVWPLASARWLRGGRFGTGPRASIVLQADAHRLTVIGFGSVMRRAPRGRHSAAPARDRRRAGPSAARRRSARSRRRPTSRAGSRGGRAARTPAPPRGRCPTDVAIVTTASSNVPMYPGPAGIAVARFVPAASSAAWPMRRLHADGLRRGREREHRARPGRDRERRPRARPCARRSRPRGPRAAG